MATHGCLVRVCQEEPGILLMEIDLKWKGHISDFLCVLVSSCLSLPVLFYNCGTHGAFFWTLADSWNSDEQHLFSFLSFLFSCQIRGYSCVVSSNLPLPPSLTFVFWLHEYLYLSLNISFCLFVCLFKVCTLTSPWMCVRSWLIIYFLRALYCQVQWRWPRFWSGCILTKAWNESVLIQAWICIWQIDDEDKKNTWQNE